jgi:hypothetical protein
MPSSNGALLMRDGRRTTTTVGDERGEAMTTTAEREQTTLDLDFLGKRVARMLFDAETATDKARDLRAEAGRLLVEAKELLGHGQWLPWLEKHGIKARTAQASMKLAGMSEDERAEARAEHARRNRESTQRRGDKRTSDAHDAEVAMLKEQVSRMQAQIERLAKELKDSQAHERMARRSAADSAAGMDKVMVRRLIQLVHPDKHGNSEASNKATQWLTKILSGMS